MGLNPKIEHLRGSKQRGEKIAMLTAYDYPVAKLLDEAGVDMLLVGDSLGMVVLGYPDTTMVTMDDMLHHARAVARAVQHAVVTADLPYGACETVEDAVANARRLMETGVHAVKLEGGVNRVAQIQAITAAGIPVVAHIGMLPQRVREEGGYKIKGKTPEQAQKLLDDAKAVEAAGAFAIVMELVKADVAETITASIQIPTIGIGSGPACDGQVLVVHDLTGMFPWFTPKFATPKATVGLDIRRAAAEFIAEVHRR